MKKFIVSSVLYTEDDWKNSKNDRKGRNQYNQQRQKKNNSRSHSRSNNQHKPSINKPIKNDKKEWSTTSETLKEEKKKR